MALEIRATGQVMVCMSGLLEHNIEPEEEEEVREIFKIMGLKLSLESSDSLDPDSVQCAVLWFLIRYNQ